MSHSNDDVTFHRDLVGWVQGKVSFDRLENYSKRQLHVAGWYGRQTNQTDRKVTFQDVCSIFATCTFQISWLQITIQATFASVEVVLPSCSLKMLDQVCISICILTCTWFSNTTFTWCKISSGSNIYPMIHSQFPSNKQKTKRHKDIHVVSGPRNIKNCFLFTYLRCTCTFNTKSLSQMQTNCWQLNVIHTVDNKSIPLLSNYRKLIVPS